MTRLLLPLAILTLPACSPLGSGADLGSGTEPVRLIQTDETQYEAQLLTDYHSRVVLEIPYQVYNQTSNPLYFVACRTSMPALEKRVGGEWRLAYAAVRVLASLHPVKIAPGEARADTLRVKGYLPGQNIAPEFYTEIEGTYRLRCDVYGGVDDDWQPLDHTLLPLEQRVSNTFGVRQAAPASP